MEGKMITVFIADDHAVFRTGLRTLLSAITHIRVVGEAGNGQELVDKVSALLPDIIITDVELPLLSGIQATKELCSRIQHCRVLALSAQDREETVLRMIEAGALGYILKNADPIEIRDAIQTLHNYKPYFCTRITEMLTQIVSRHLKMPPKVEVFFTERETEIIRLICEQYTSKAIAYSLNLSKRTIEGHRTRIMDKIGAKSVAGVITFAYENGMNKK